MRYGIDVRSALLLRTDGSHEKAERYYFGVGWELSSKFYAEDLLIDTRLSSPLEIALLYPEVPV